MCRSRLIKKFAEDKKTAVSDVSGSCIPHPAKHKMEKTKNSMFCSLSEPQFRNDWPLTPHYVAGACSINANVTWSTLPHYTSRPHLLFASPSANCCIFLPHSQISISSTKTSLHSIIDLHFSPPPNSLVKG